MQNVYIGTRHLILQRFKLQNITTALLILALISLTCLEIRSEILQDIYFSYRIQRFVSELTQYTFYFSNDWIHVCSRRLYACIITRNSRLGIDLREITSLPEIKNIMRTWHIIPIFTQNKPHAHHKTHLHTTKVFNTLTVSLS